MGNLTHLDGKSLQTFIETELKDFVTQTENIRRDKSDSADGRPPGRALKSLIDGTTTPETLQQNQFLALGPMVNDDLTHGKSLIESTTKSAKSLEGILEQQQRLFRDIDRDFRQTLKLMGATQSDNITEIDAQKLLDIFQDVDHDMSPTSDSKTTTDV
ncbi:type VII secretion system-associated protein [Streptomyces sp. NPDC001276]|uniref:type VII secretion system-associated protein n=1 Tax=Streptomyces sp. NPDC001276 TaxID=3364555 RepID=UPI00367EFC6A